MDPCSLHWNSLLRTDAGSDAAGGGQWAGAAGGGGGAVQGGAAARQKRPLLYVGVLTRPSARDKRDALRRAAARAPAPPPPLLLPRPLLRLTPGAPAPSFLALTTPVGCRRTWFRQGSGEWVGAFFLGRPKNDSKLAAELEARASRGTCGARALRGSAPPRAYPHHVRSAARARRRRRRASATSSS